MYAIIKHGSRQYRVEQGQEIEIDYREATAGDEVKFEQVLAAGSGADLRFGAPFLAGASVSANVVGTVQGPKLVVQKFRRRKNSRRRTGHRQLYTKVRIAGIAV
ncbi:MAG: 50S ribosomal protein L21 [Pirellulales bacterium]